LNEFAAGARDTITSLAYGRSDGMLNVESNGGYWPAGVKARDGKLWFPTQDGVAVIDTGNSDFSNVRVMPHSTAPNKPAGIASRWRKLGAPANHPEFPLCLPGRQPGLRRERNWGLGNLGTKSPLRNREHEIGTSKTFAFRRVAVGGARISISNI
jgi:hypothetical protein